MTGITMPTKEVEEAALELVAHCLCGAQRFTAEVARSSLPLAAIYCHCTSCRRATGALYSTYVAWPGAAGTIRASSLRRYVFAGTITLLSCGVCGSTMFAETTAGDGSARYGVQTGVLANAAADLLRIAHHIFVGDTQDGGATPWLCDANRDGSRPRLWTGHRDQGDEILSTKHRWPLPLEASPAPEETPVRCHCGGVDLVLGRPIADFAAEERSALPWFVDPVSNKSLAGFDACDSCRLASGSDIFHWTFVLLRHLAFPRPTSDAPVQTGFPASSIELKTAVAPAPSDRDPRWGTLTFYESSPDVQRYFCSRCSACVFYAAGDRPELVDLAIGLLHSKNGSRAEDLVSWDFGGKMVWRQDVVGGWREAFVESVEAAADRWRIERGYPKNWRRTQKEEAAAKDEN